MFKIELILINVYAVGSFNVLYESRISEKLPWVLFSALWQSIFQLIQEGF